MNNKLLEQWISESIVSAGEQYRREYLDNLNEYKKAGWWTVKESICLLFCNDPYSSELIRKISGDIATRLEWQILRADDRMLTVKGNAGDDVLDRFVRPVEFLRWAMSLGYPVPAGLKDFLADTVPQATQNEKPVAEVQDAPLVAATTTRPSSNKELELDQEECREIARLIRCGNPDKPTSTIAKEIASGTHVVGKPCAWRAGKKSPDAVRKWIEKACPAPRTGRPRKNQ